jgi:hypothetical protein
MPPEWAMARWKPGSFQNGRAAEIGVRGMTADVYVSRDGRRTPVVEMETRHLVNALRVLTEQARLAIAAAKDDAALGRGSWPLPEPWMRTPEALAEHTFPPYAAMVRELARRGGPGPGLSREAAAELGARWMLKIAAMARANGREAWAGSGAWREYARERYTEPDQETLAAAHAVLSLMLREDDEVYVDYENWEIDRRMAARGFPLDTHTKFGRKSGVRLVLDPRSGGYRVQVKHGRGDPYTDAEDLE